LKGPGGNYVILGALRVAKNGKGYLTYTELLKHHRAAGLKDTGFSSRLWELGPKQQNLIERSGNRYYLK
jgi:hypothetical protein